jgi:hypothetical protein
MHVLAAAAIALFSMPGLGGGDEEGIEVPAANEMWKATVVDSTLTETQLEEFSMEGFTHVQGKLGAGEISIRFDDIARIDFEPTEKTRSLALVQLKDGSVKKLSVDGRSALYGKTGFGSYKVLLKDVKRVVFTAGPFARPEKTPKASAPPPPPPAPAPSAKP